MRAVSPTALADRHERPANGASGDGGSRSIGPAPGNEPPPNIGSARSVANASGTNHADESMPRQIALARALVRTYAPQNIGDGPEASSAWPLPQLPQSCPERTPF